MIELFERYEHLKEKLPYIQLGNFPTPVSRMAILGQQLDLKNLYLKEDGKSGEIYGGNKVRKLEFLLGDARQKEATVVGTYGCAGSNHALATVIYGRSLGMEVHTFLYPQENSKKVRENLKLELWAGAEMHLRPDFDPGKMEQVVRRLKTKVRLSGQKPAYIIPSGGSNPLGVMGFVSAGLELCKQIENGEMPLPDFIYCPMGTMGTVAGILIGLKLAGVKSKVVAVQVVDEPFVSDEKLHLLFKESADFLFELDENIPRLALSAEDYEIRSEFLGGGYGISTPEAEEAVSTALSVQGVPLETTYSGKAFAAFLQDAREKRFKNKTALFWHTLNVRDLSKYADMTDEKKLPKEAQVYFEEADERPKFF